MSVEVRTNDATAASDRAPPRAGAIWLGAGDIPITVVVPVKNEEKNLSRCLAQLTRFAEVIIVDSMSTDTTPEIARNSGAKLLQFSWDGKFPKKRNWFLMNHKPGTDWVLFLDADEVVDDAFCDEARAAVTSGKHNAYWLNYSNFFLGRELVHGIPQRKLALLKVGSGLYERIDEMSWSKLDMEIHEHPIVEGSVGEISAVIEHNDFRGISRFVDRHRDYAMWEAQRTLVLERQGGAGAAGLTGRQKFKYANMERWWYPWFYFCFAYFAKGGCLDGSAGFTYAFYKAWYFLTIRLLIKELRAVPVERV